MKSETRITLIPLKPGFEDIFVAQVEPIVESTRQIAGCLVFDVYRLSEERTRLVVHEVWETHDAFVAYNFGPLKAEMISLVNGLVVEPIRAWEAEQIF